MAAAKFNEGDRIVTCGTSPGFHSNGNYYAPKVYEARVRKKDGALVWKLSYVAKDHEMAVPGWKPTQAALRMARAYARDNALPFAVDIKDNLVVATAKKPVKKAAVTRKRKVAETGEVVEEPIAIGRFKKINDDDIV